LRTNHLKERGNHMIQAMSDLNVGVVSSWNYYQKIQEVFVYVGVNFRWIEVQTCDIGKNRLYEFCYLLPFNLWTFYLARILFLQGCGSLFWESPSSTSIFNGL
jgi:hypothetical protein